MCRRVGVLVRAARQGCKSGKAEVRGKKAEDGQSRILITLEWMDHQPQTERRRPILPSAFLLLPSHSPLIPAPFQSTILSWRLSI